MHNPESVRENEMHKILLDFETQTDHLISARRPDLMIVKTREREREKEREKTYLKVDFAVQVDHRVKLKESEERDKYPDLNRKLF